mgnify:CR=1 FL=1
MGFTYEHLYTMRFNVFTWYIFLSMRVSVYPYIFSRDVEIVRTLKTHPIFFIRNHAVIWTYITHGLLRYILYTRTVPVLYAYVRTQYRTTKIFAVRTVSKYFTYLRYEPKRCIDLATPRVLDLLA